MLSLATTFNFAKFVSPTSTALFYLHTLIPISWQLTAAIPARTRQLKIMVMGMESPEHQAHVHSKSADPALSCARRADAGWHAAGLLQTKGMFFRMALAVLRNGCATSPETEHGFGTYTSSWASLTRNYSMGTDPSPSSPITATCKILLNCRF